MTAAMSSPKTRTFSWQDPQPDWARAKQVSGLEYMRELLAAGALRAPPIAATLDFHLREVDFGLAVFEGLPQEYHYNPIGTVHGGYAATLLDSALGCAVHTTLEPGFGYTTLELKVNFVRPLTKDTGLVRVEGKIISAGKRVATAEARLTDAAGRVCSHGTTTCLIFPLP